MARSVGRAVTDHFAAGRRLPLKPVLRGLRRVPGWEYLPARVKSVAMGAANPPLSPTHVQIEPTYRCNLRCVMCAPTYGGRQRLPDMSLDFFKEILDQLPELKMLSLNGLGEPMLNKHFVDMLEYAREKGVYTRFTTNLTRLTDEQIERLIACGHSEITVSIETTDPETFADIRRGASLDLVLGNLRKIAAAKERLNSDTPMLIVYGILLKCVLDQIPDLVRTVKDLGVARLTFVDLCTNALDLNQPMRDGSCLGDNVLLNSMTEAEIWDLLNGIKSLGDEAFEVVIPGDYGGLKNAQQKGPGILTCDELWEMPFVTCEGYVTPCCWAPDPSLFNMGNLHDQRFEDVWFSPAYFRLRLRHLAGKPPPFCAACQQLVCTTAAPSRFRGSFEAGRCHTRGFLFK